jgi:hypothetical protein
MWLPSCGWLVAVVVARIWLVSWDVVVELWFGAMMIAMTSNGNERTSERRGGDECTNEQMLESRKKQTINLSLV